MQHFPIYVGGLGGKYIQLDDSEGDEFEPKELRLVVCNQRTNVVAELVAKLDESGWLTAEFTPYPEQSEVQA